VAALVLRALKTKKPHPGMGDEAKCDLRLFMSPANRAGIDTKRPVEKPDPVVVASSGP